MNRDAGSAVDGSVAGTAVEGREAVSSAGGTEAGAAVTHPDAGPEHGDGPATTEPHAITDARDPGATTGARDAGATTDARDAGATTDARATMDDRDTGTTADTGATADTVADPRTAEAPAIPEQQGDDEPGPAGRHTLRAGVDTGPIPVVDLPEQAGPPDPLTPASRSRGTAAPTGGSALAALDLKRVGPAAESAPGVAGARPGPYPGSVPAPTDGSEPPHTHRVKVHSGSHRFHTPESPYYVRTRADLYFTGEQQARAAGFIAWYERPGAR